MRQKCNAIGARGARCRRNAERDPFTVDGYTLDFCARHNQMVREGQEVVCTKCQVTVIADAEPSPDEDYAAHDASTPQEKISQVQRALDNHEKLKGSYFWKNLGNASSRRNDEKRHNFRVKVTHNGDIYEYQSHVRVSVKNFYYTGTFRKNGKKGDVRLFQRLRWKGWYPGELTASR
jgi:hypothetical protein